MLAAALAALVVAAGPAFIEDDFPAALAKAKAGKKLLFVDAWAPWCHSCVFMREHVLTQEAFKAFEKDVVFAAVDTEQTKNAGFLEQYPVSVWPTLLFIDAQKGAVVRRWAGTVDALQMRALIASALKPNAAGVGRADALLAEGKMAEAASQYLSSAAGQDVEAITLLSMVTAFSLAQQRDACARTVDEGVGKLSSVVDQAAVVAWGLGCAVELDSSVAANRVLLRSLAQKAEALVTKEGPLADDVSGLYELLVEERSVAKDAPGALRFASSWLDYLEAQAKAARTPAARAVFDAHRTSAALAAKKPERALPALVASEKDFPRDYNPPARQALVLLELKRLDEAKAAIERALTKCTEGPRKLRLFSIQGSILEKQGDAAGRKKALQAAVAWAKALPKAQLPAGRVEKLEAELAALK